MKSIKQKGITLVALIITIIILLILAGVTIMLLTGKDSVVFKGEISKTSTRISQEKEGVSMLMSTSKLEKLYALVTANDLQRMAEKVLNEKVEITQDEGNTIRIKY